MTDPTTRCIECANALFERTLPAFPPRESRAPVGWPIVILELTEPIHARVVVRSAADAIDPAGIADVPAAEIPRELIQAVRSWLEQTVGQMPEDAARRLVERARVVVDVSDETIAIAEGSEFAHDGDAALH